MPSFRQQITIDRSPEAVFATLAIPATAVRIQAGTTRCELTSPPPLRAGSRLRAVRTLEGRTVDGEVEVAAFRPGKEIEFVGGAQGIKLSYRYSLKPVGAPDPAATAVESTRSGTGRGRP